MLAPVQANHQHESAAEQQREKSEQQRQADLESQQQADLESQQQAETQMHQRLTETELTIFPPTPTSTKPKSATWKFWIAWILATFLGFILWLFQLATTVSLRKDISQDANLY